MAKPYCPVCERDIKNLTDVCPHVAVAHDTQYGGAVIYVNGEAVDFYHDVSELPMDVLTYMGTIDEFDIYFCPNPEIFADALFETELTGVPADIIYRKAWIGLGMEHDHWEEG